MVLSSLDFETPPIRHLDIAPRPITLSLFDGETIQARGNGDPDFWDLFLQAISDRSVFCNAAFDMSAASFERPEFVPKIMAAFFEGRVSCVKNLEKLISIADQGNMRVKTLANGNCVPLLYDLASLEKRWLGRDRSAQKGDSKAVSKRIRRGEARGDDLRFNFDTFDGWKIADYPPEAVAYVYEDAKSPWEIYHLQLAELDRIYRGHLGTPFPRHVESLHTALDYLLYLTSGFGVWIDRGAVAELSDWVESQLSDEAMDLLIAAGVLRPSEPERDAKNGRVHVAGCPGKNCLCPRKRVKAKKSTLNKAVLQQLVVEVCHEHDVPVLLTETGQVSCAAEVMEEIADYHPVLQQYQEKTDLDGIRNREIPRMCAPIIHTKYDALKVTGRTSCAADDAYPSGNIQNVDPRARKCYIAPPPDEESEWAILSVDYSIMELATCAQVMKNLFGKSTHLDLINSGVEMHGYLAASIAYNLDADFRGWVNESGVRPTHRGLYDVFQPLKKEPKDSPLFAFWKEKRTMSKPTGLGYPGGLGPKTFISFAKGQYGVKGLTIELATHLRDIWFEIHPDMHDYFALIKRERRDGVNSRVEKIKKPGTKETEEKLVQRYWYTTPMGMLRRGCKYTEACNGQVLQSPGAELAKLGFALVARACLDESQGSILWTNARPMGFVHDEALVYVRLNKWTHECAQEVKRLMVEGGKVVVPDVDLKANEALMLRWNKDAEGVFDENGRIVPWLPKK